MGRIKEFPGLQIDDFRTFDKTPPVVTLLTHAHSDHLLGLDRQGYRGPAVWCTDTTRSLVLNLRSNNDCEKPPKYQHLRKEACGIELLRPMKLDTAQTFACGSLTLSVTAVDAHHCPGSCMFLVQSESTAVLYTGDVKCEKWYLGMLNLHPALVRYTVGRNPINLYVDNIYEQHEKKELEYLDSARAIEALIDLLRRGYPPESSFCALFTTTGYELVLLALSAYFKTRIHMDKYYYSLYLSASSTCPVSKAIVDCSTTDSEAKCRLHWCQKGKCPPRDAKNAVFFSPCVTISEEAVEERNSTLDITRFQVAGNCDMPVYANPLTGARYILSTNGRTLLPGHMLFYFSRHASQPCLKQLIEIFAARIVRSLDGNPMEGFSSLKLEGDELSTENVAKDGAEPHLRGPLPILRKQAVRVNDNVKQIQGKRLKSSSSSTNSDALWFLSGQPSTQTVQGAAQGKLESLPEHPLQGSENTHKHDPVALIELMQNEILAESRREAADGVAPSSSSLHDETQETQEGLQELDISNAPEEESGEDPAAPLEEQLRKDESTWFSLKFDWNK